MIATEAALVLPSQPASVAAARRFVATQCRRWQLTGDGAQLVVSELVTNAVRYAGGEVTVTVRRIDDHIIVAVRDDSPRRPKLLDVAEDSTSGRGLAIVDAVADRWDVDLHGPAGKTVWAEISGA
jgi:anti-sigma regulatory factor (Ser/Thr protein kinase)